MLVGRHPELGDAFAAFDRKARFTVPAIAPTKFAAWLKPFGSREDATAALETAGATVEASQ